MKKLLLLYFTVVGVILLGEVTNSVVIVHEDNGKILDNLDYGIPGGQDVIIDREGFATGYSYSKMQPIWVSYRLTADEVTNKVIRRPRDAFKRDYILGNFSALPGEYLNTGYDRGHIAPAADMMWSKFAMFNSFFMSNMSPQKPRFNRGIWAKLESWVRETAISNESVIVYSGPIFGTNYLCVAHGVAVPDSYFKVIMTETEPKRCIAFILPNEGSTMSLSSFACPVDTVERITGLDFLNELNCETQSNIESTVDLNLWNL